MMKSYLMTGILSLSSVATFAFTAPVHAQTALVGNVFVNSDASLIRPSGFYQLSGIGGYGAGLTGYGAYGLGSGCGTGIAGAYYSGCGATLLSAPALYASACGATACSIPVLPFSDCPLLWR